MIAKAARELGVVIPGLLGSPQIEQFPEAWQDLSLAALETLLSRGRRTKVRGIGLERALFELFNIAIAPGKDVPVAAVTRQWEAQDAGGYWWLRADPVHLRADRDRIIMLGNDALDISNEECRDLASELNSHFTHEDWQLDARNARRWYLRLDNDPRINTEMLCDVIGQDILHYMPRGIAEQHWRSVMNEVQMILHSSRVNKEREMCGAPVINSLWFWGGGRLPCPVSVNWSQVWGNDALSQGLASIMKVGSSSMPSEASDWLENDIPGEHMLVIDGLREKIQFADIEGWHSFLHSLHEAWLEPLFIALKQGHLTALNLYPADGTMFRVTAGDARRWWVRRRSMPQWIKA